MGINAFRFGSIQVFSQVGRSASSEGQVVMGGVPDKPSRASEDLQKEGHLVSEVKDFLLKPLLDRAFGLVNPAHRLTGTAAT